jgi:hypothetical protein
VALGDGFAADSRWGDAKELKYGLKRALDRLYATGDGALAVRVDDVVDRMDRARIEQGKQSKLLRDAGHDAHAIYTDSIIPIPSTRKKRGEARANVESYVVHMGGVTYTDQSTGDRMVKGLVLRGAEPCLVNPDLQTGRDGRAVKGVIGAVEMAEGPNAKRQRM